MGYCCWCILFSGVLQRVLVFETPTPKRQNNVESAGRGNTWGENVYLWWNRFTDSLCKHTHTQNVFILYVYPDVQPVGVIMQCNKPINVIHPQTMPAALYMSCCQFCGLNPFFSVENDLTLLWRYTCHFVIHGKTNLTLLTQSCKIPLIKAYNKPDIMFNKH